jgi:hypothetical protein
VGELVAGRDLDCEVARVIMGRNVAPEREFRSAGNGDHHFATAICFAALKAWRLHVPPKGRVRLDQSWDVGRLPALDAKRATHHIASEPLNVPHIVLNMNEGAPHVEP